MKISLRSYYEIYTLFITASVVLVPATCIYFYYL